MRRACLILLLMLTGCQLRPLPPLQYQLAGGQYQLQTRWPGSSQQLLQQVTFVTAGEQQQFLLSVLLQADQMLLVALSPVGHELWRIQLLASGQLTQSGIKPFSEAAFATALLAQMQWSIWPLGSLQPALQDLALTEQAGVRVLTDRQRHPLMTIRGSGAPEQGRVTELVNKHFRLTLTTLEQEFL